MIWLNLLGMGIKTGSKNCNSDKQKFKENMSEAKLLHSEKMKKRRDRISRSGI